MIDTSNFSCTTPMLTLKIELEKVTVNTRDPMQAVIAHLLFWLQFFGFPGSFGPSNSTNVLSSPGWGCARSPRPFSRSGRASFEFDRSSLLFMGFSTSFAHAESVEVRFEGAWDKLGPRGAISAAIAPGVQLSNGMQSQQRQGGVFIRQHPGDVEKFISGVGMELRS